MTAPIDLRPHLILLAFQSETRRTPIREAEIDQQTAMHHALSHPFGAALFPAMPILLQFARSTSGPTGHFETTDVFFAGLLALAQNDALVPTWLVIACQINMDIHEVVPTDDHAIGQALLAMDSKDAPPSDEVHDFLLGDPAELIALLPVSYTHLTLPTKRIV